MTVERRVQSGSCKCMGVYIEKVCSVERMRSCITSGFFLVPSGVVRER
jgi:hypothetical protein